MNLLINQFTVRYQGKDYGPGSVIYNMDKKEAAALIAGSNGTIFALPEREETQGEKGEKTSTSRSNKRGKDTGATVEDMSSTTEDVADITALPAIDPSQTVK